MVDDCIVGEVRRLRQRQASKHGFDVKTISAAAKSDRTGRGERLFRSFKRRQWAAP